MGVAWRGRCVSPSILSGRRAASSPVNHYILANPFKTLLHQICTIECCNVLVCRGTWQWVATEKCWLLF